MRVIAIDRGYDGLCVREPDAVDALTGGPVVFDMPDGAEGGWFVEADEDGKPLVERPKVAKSRDVPGAGPKPGSQLKHKA